MPEETGSTTGDRRTLRIGQLLLVVAALGLWIASRMPWVALRSADGLGAPKTVTLSGSTWSTALLPLALLLLAAAVAALAVRGWRMRVVAVLVGAVSALTAYLAVSLWVMRDVAVRAAELAQVSVISLVGSERHYTGAVVTGVSAVLALVAAVLLLRSAAAGRGATTKYVAPAARRAAVDSTMSEGGMTGARVDTMSERMIWDALDEGRDPTEPRGETPGPGQTDSDTEGR
jgi:uncharacterized membrane protein (TIGR02234 family)